MPAERSVDNDVERDLFDAESPTFLYTERSTEQKLAQQIIENEINIMNDVELLFIHMNLCLGNYLQNNIEIWRILLEIIVTLSICSLALKNAHFYLKKNYEFFSYNVLIHWNDDKSISFFLQNKTWKGEYCIS